LNRKTEADKNAYISILSVMKTKLLSLLNLIVTFLLIYWNYLSNTGFIRGKTIGELSAKYDSLFTPAGYAFSIWGIIFLGLIAFGIFAVYLAFKKPESYFHVEKAIPLMIGVNLLNGAWVYYWLTEEILMSLIIMFLMFSWLLKIIISLRMEIWDAPCKIIALVWWPIDLYFGWIMVALVANASSYLNSIGFSMGLKEQTWVLIMIGAVTLINLFLIQKRNLREAALVAIWAFIAIAVRHWETETELSYVALLGAGVLLLANQRHAIKNKATLPFVKKKWSEEI
jgi:hypothetical protein